MPQEIWGGIMHLSEYELNISAIFNNANKMGNINIWHPAILALDWHRRQIGTRKFGTVIKKKDNLSLENLAPFGTAVYSYLLDFMANMQLALRARGSQSSLAVRFTISEVRIQLGLRAV